MAPDFSETPAAPVSDDVVSIGNETSQPPAESGTRTRKLEVLAYVAVIVVSLLTLAVKWARRPPEPLVAGDKIEVAADLLSSGVDRTLLLVISPDCPHCTKSMPFFKQIVAHRNEAGSPVEVVVALHEKIPIEEEHAILDEHSVTVDRIVPVDLKDLGVLGVPTLMLVDREGTILEIWNGRLDAEQQKQLLAKL